MRTVSNGLLRSAAGDSEEIAFRLHKPGLTVADWSAYNVYCFGKLDPDDTDEAAVFQKTTGAGLTVDDGISVIDIVPVDTVERPLTTIYVGYRAEHIETGARHTFDGFVWQLGQAIVQHTDASIPIYTSTPPTGDTFGERVVSAVEGEEIKPGSVVMRNYRAADDSELPKTRMIVDRGDAEDEDNQDYMAFLITQNLDFLTNTRDDLTLPAARLGLEYNYGAPVKVMELNMDLQDAEGGVIPRPFNAVFPLDGSRGTLTAELDVAFKSLTIDSVEVSTGYSVDVVGPVRMKGPSPGGPLYHELENTATGHNSACYTARGNATAGASGWIFGLDPTSAGSKNWRIRQYFGSYDLVFDVDFTTSNITALLGDLKAATVGKGLVAASPNGALWRLTPSNAGESVWTAL